MKRPFVAGDLVTVDGAVPADVWRVRAVYRDGRVRLSRYNDHDLVLARWAKLVDLRSSIPLEAADEEWPSPRESYRRRRSDRIRTTRAAYAAKNREALNAANHKHYALHKAKILARKKEFLKGIKADPAAHAEYKARRQAHREANRQKLRDAAKAYREANKEAVRAADRARRKTPKDREASRARYALNKDRINARRRELTALKGANGNKRAAVEAPRSP